MNNNEIKKRMKKMFSSAGFVLICLLLSGVFRSYAQQGSTFDPQAHAVIRTDRPDGRYLSSRGVLHAMLKRTTPRYTFHADMDTAGFESWKSGLREAMKEVMCYPEVNDQPLPRKIGSVQRKGYRVEKWEAYPLPECVAPFLVLIPDGVDEKHPAPAVMCIPGSGESKETSAGEPELNPKYGEDEPLDRWIIALPYVEQGMVAVVVDNAGAGEVSDLEGYTIAPRYQYEAVARYLLELGWSYLGYNSFIDKQILDWMKTRPEIQRERIIICGFSLGTEPMMVLGVLDPEIYGFVYNDFLCRTLERAIVMTEPDKNGVRPFPNSIRHLIPRFWCNFDFPDIVASLAPRPILFTEGGLDRDLNLVKEAYRIAGKPDHIEVHFYPKYADPKTRKMFGADTLPEGINRRTYFGLVNVDDPMHDIKAHFMVPWVKKYVLAPEQ